MKILKILVLAAVIAVGYQQWSKHNQSQIMAKSQVNPNGFISAAMPKGLKPGVVLILAPPNCPSQEAQRAADLANNLMRMDIPVQQSSSFLSEITDPTEEEKAQVDRSLLVLNGEIPAVFLNGMGKANPTVEEVVAEFRRTQ